MEKDRGERTCSKSAILKAFPSTATRKTCTLKALWLCFLLLWAGFAVLHVCPSRSDLFSHLTCHGHFDRSPLTFFTLTGPLHSVKISADVYAPPDVCKISHTYRQLAMTIKEHLRYELYKYFMHGYQSVKLAFLHSILLYLH